MADISKTTTDSSGIARLLSNSILSIQFVDVSKSGFANPDSSFTGFAADGYYYLNGAPDPTFESSLTHDGITYTSEFKATWASEAEHTEATSSRGLLDRFPDRMFVIATDKEVSLLDADDLTLWMRFTISSSSFSSVGGPILGGAEASIVGASFSEGVLYVATTKGIRLVNFPADLARYITTSDSYVGYGIGSGKRNADTFYIYDEFEPTLASLTSDWKSLSPSSYSYSVSDALLLYLRLDDGWSDESVYSWPEVHQAKSSHSSSDYPSLVSDTPKTLTGSDPHSMSFNNSYKSSADWDGSFGYVDQAVSMSFTKDEPFTFALFIKVNSRGDPDWSAKPDMPLFAKVLKGSDMRATFSEASDLYEFSASIDSATGCPQITIYLENDPTAYVTHTATGASPEIPLDTWVHLAFSYSGPIERPAPIANSSNWTIYKNGVAYPGLTTSVGPGAGTVDELDIVASSAPLFIGCSGQDGSSISGGDWFDGNILEFGYWKAPFGQLTASAIKEGLIEGVPTSSEDPSYLMVDSCLSIDSGVVNNNSVCAIGHVGGLTAIVQPNNRYASSYKHDFSVLYDAGDWAIVAPDLNIVTTTGTGLTGNGWVKGDLITLDGDTYTIEKVNDSSIETKEVMTAHATDSSEIGIKRQVPTVLVDNKDLYYAHSVGKVSRESSLWYSTSSLTAFDAVTGVVELSGADILNNFAISGSDLYISADCGVFIASEANFSSSSIQGSTLQYSSTAGNGKYKILAGGADSGTCVGVDPETGHILVANTGVDAIPSVTEIDTSIHQAFQSFDANTSPKVDSPVTAMATYRNVMGPPDVEVS